jgi:hypothetical protein
MKTLAQTKFPLQLVMGLKRPLMKKRHYVQKYIPDIQDTSFTRKQNKSPEGDTMKQIARRRYVGTNRTKVIH